MNEKIYFILILSLAFLLGMSAISASDNNDISENVTYISADSSDIGLDDANDDAKMELLSVGDNGDNILKASNESEKAVKIQHYTVLKIQLQMQQN